MKPKYFEEDEAGTIRLSAARMVTEVDFVQHTGRAAGEIAPAVFPDRFPPAWPPKSA